MVVVLHLMRFYFPTLPGECVLSLKDMFTGEPCYFEATMTHYGEETGKLK